MTQLDQVLASLGAASLAEIVVRREMWALQRGWRQAFASTGDDWSGLGDFDWHAFSYCRVPHRRGIDAIVAYGAVPLSSLIVTESLKHGSAFKTCFDVLPA